MLNVDPDLGALARAIRGRHAAAGRPRGLDAFLRHASATCAWYRDAPLSINDRNAVSRSTVARNLDAFVSDAFAAADLAFWQTSGTTGIPLRVPRDLASSYLYAYDTYKVVARYGGWLGSCRPGELAVVQLNDNPLRPQQALLNPALRHAAIHRVTLGSHDSSVVTAASHLRRSSPLAVSGRPRALLRLAESLRGASRRFRLLAVIASGDNLYPESKRTLEAAFGSPVFNVYASQECGLVAVSCTSGSMHVVESRVRAEILAADGCITSSGEGELIVTNMENWALPLIRYETGDRGRLERVLCQCGRRGAVIAQLFGRDSIYFTLHGRRLNPSALTPSLERQGVLQFQVVQHPDESLLVTLWLHQGASASDLRSSIAKDLDTLGFARTRVSLASADTTDLKRPRFRRL